MVEKGIRGRLWQYIYGYAKSNKQIYERYDKK